MESITWTQVIRSMTVIAMVIGAAIYVGNSITRLETQVGHLISAVSDLNRSRSADTALLATLTAQYGEHSRRLDSHQAEIERIRDQILSIQRRSGT